MSLRDRLLALLRDPAYSPGNEFELSRRLALKNRDRAALVHEVRLLLKDGKLTRTRNGRLTAGAPAAPERPPEKRAIFVPTRRGPTMPPPGTKDTSRPVAASPAIETRRSPARAKPGHPTAAPTTPPAEPVAAKRTREPDLRPGELLGKIQFRAGGSAYIVRENVAGEVAEPALQVFPEDTGVALPGDRVVAREHPGRKGKRAAAGHSRRLSRVRHRPQRRRLRD
jgi:hypothetical protein